MKSVALHASQVQEGKEREMSRRKKNCLEGVKRKRQQQHARRHTRPGCRIGNFLLFWISSSFCFPPFSCFPDMRWRGTAQEKSRSKKCHFLHYVTFIRPLFWSSGSRVKKIGPQNEKNPPTYQIFLSGKWRVWGKSKGAHLKMWKGEREGRRGIRKMSMHSFLFASLFSGSLDFPEICSAN